MISYLMSDSSDSSTSPASSNNTPNGKRKGQNTSKMSVSPSSPVPDDDPMSMKRGRPSPMPDEDPMSMKRGRKESEQRRRVLMNQYFDEMIILLSMISERKIPKKMDKVSTLHEAVKCMQKYSDLTVTTKPKPKPKPKGKGSSKMYKEIKLGGMYPDLISSGEVLHFFLDAHDTFLILISESGHVLYATELVTSLLGHMQTRLVGQNIFDYVLESDKRILLEMLNPGDVKPTPLQSNGQVLAYPSRSFKCHFSMYSGETCGLPQHLPFMCLSYLRQWKTEDSSLPGSPPLSPLECDDMEPMTPSSATSQHQACVLLGKLPTQLTFLDLPVGLNDVNFTFEIRVSKEGNIVNVNSHAILVLGYTESELVGSRFFDYIDPYHLIEVGDHMTEFFKNGRGTTNPYRFFTKGGRYVWLLSKGYLSYNPWNHKPDHILLYNRVLGCDHVLPEYRFFRSRTYLPDMEGEELYNPPPLQKEPVQQQPLVVQQHLQQDHQQLWQPGTPMQGVQSYSNVQSHSSQNSTFPYAPSLPLASPLIGSQSTAPLQSAHRGSMKSETSSSIREGECGERIVTSGSRVAALNPEQRLGLESREGNLGVNMQTGSNSNSGENSNFMVDFRQEMEKKNQELFTMQRRLLEQQMLMEQERNQFYQMAQQVMQCIGGNSALSVASSLPPNLQMSCLTSQANQQTQGLQKSPTHSSANYLPESSATQAYQISPSNPYSKLLQNKHTSSMKPVDISPYANLQSRLGMAQSPSTPLMPTQMSGNPISPSIHVANTMLSTCAQKQQQSHQQQPGQAQGNDFQQQMQQKPSERYHHQQQLQLQQLQNRQLSAFTPVAQPTVSSLNLPQGGINLPQVPQFPLQNMPTSSAALATFQSPMPFQALSTQLRLSSLPSHPSLHTLPATQLPRISQASDMSQPSDFSSGPPMRLPNDEDIQNLLDAIQMKCSDTDMPTVSSM